MAELVTAYLSLGSNMGNREENLDHALKLLGERLRVGEISGLYDTAPLGNTDQPRFLNLACSVQTRLTPENLLTLVKGIELKIGRHGRTGEPRPIDIDILLYDDVILETPDLVIPHPRMAQREFVLVPLAEIAPKKVHPVTKKTIKQMRLALKEKQGVFKWETA